VTLVPARSPELVRAGRGVTDLMPEVAREARTCTARRHTATHSAWQDGCRCPGAEAAHDRYKAIRRERNRHRPAQLDEHGNCVAAMHRPSTTAYRRGCRCPGSIEAHERELETERAAAARRRPYEPWKPFRGPDMRVSRWNLFLLLHGFPDSPTKAERIAAVRILAGRGLDNARTARVIGVTEATVQNLKDAALQLRADRDQRRAGDAALREHRRRQAIERGRGHDASGHPMHPWWRLMAYERIVRETGRASRTGRRATEAALRAQRRERAIARGRGHDRSGHPAPGRASAFPDP
jgi:hypothetical protein